MQIIFLDLRLFTYFRILRWKKFMCCCCSLPPCYCRRKHQNRKNLTSFIVSLLSENIMWKSVITKGICTLKEKQFKKFIVRKKRVELKRGPWKWYHRNGQLKDSVFYTDAGLPTGIETLYNSDGSIHQTIDYGTSTNFIIRERNWLTTIAKDYTRTYYYKTPNIPKKTQVYKNKKKDGVWKTYDTNGKVISEKTYSKGKLISNP